MKLNKVGILFFSVSIISCTKSPGPGGNSQIVGSVNYYDHSFSRAEIFQITPVSGNDLNGGEYIMLNTPTGSPNYYVWFNDGGVSDPAFPDRTGIQVTFNGSSNPTSIATSIANGLSASAGSDYSVSRSGDIVTVACVTEGEVADGFNASTPIEIDVIQQGRDGSLVGPFTAQDVEVFLTYGDESVYSKTFNTDASGKYQFRGLTKGMYKIHLLSKDTLSASGQVEVSKSVEITSNRQTVEVTELSIID